jgi:hypothetical protein
MPFCAMILLSVKPSGMVSLPGILERYRFPPWPALEDAGMSRAWGIRAMIFPSDEPFQKGPLRMQKFSAVLLSWSSPRTTSLFIAPHHCAVICYTRILSKSRASLCVAVIGL